MATRASRRRTRAQVEPDEDQEAEDVVEEAEPAKKRKRVVFDDKFNTFYVPYQVYTRDQATSELLHQCGTSTYASSPDSVVVEAVWTRRDPDEVGLAEPSSQDPSLLPLHIVRILFVELNATEGSHFCHHARFCWIPNTSDYDDVRGLTNTQRTMLFVRGKGIQGLDKPATFLYAGVWKCYSQSLNRAYFDLVFPGSVRGEFLEGLGPHLVKCEKNKYGATMCFIRDHGVVPTKITQPKAVVEPSATGEAFWSAPALTDPKFTASEDPIGLALQQTKECATWDRTTGELAITVLREGTLTDGSADLLAGAAQFPGSGLQHLTFIFGLLKDGLTPIGARALATMISTAPALRTVAIHCIPYHGSINTPNIYVEAIARGCKSPTSTVRALTLSGVRIDAQFLRTAFAEGILQSKALKRLSLANASGIKEAIEGISALLMPGRTPASLGLGALNLPRGWLGDSARHLAPLLETSTTITFLDISENRIQQWLVDICEAIGKRNQLKEFRAGKNEIKGTQSVVCFGHLEACKSLGLLDWSDHSLGKGGLTALVKLAESNPMLQTIIVNGCGLKAEQITALKKLRPDLKFLA